MSKVQKDWQEKGLEFINDYVDDVDEALNFEDPSPSFQHIKTWEDFNWWKNHSSQMETPVREEFLWWLEHKHNL